MKAGRESTKYTFWHESFEVKNGNYEAIFVNSPPMFLGNCHGSKIVPATGNMKSAAGRAGKTDGSDYDEKTFGKADY